MPPHARNAPPVEAAVPMISTSNILINENIIGIEFFTGHVLDSIWLEVANRSERVRFGGDGGDVSIREEWATEPRSVYISNISGESFRTYDKNGLVIDLTGRGYDACHYLRVTFRFEGGDEYRFLECAGLRYLPGVVNDRCDARITARNQKCKQKYGKDAWSTEKCSFSKDFIKGDIIDFNVGLLSPATLVIVSVK